MAFGADKPFVMKIAYAIFLPGFVIAGGPRNLFDGGGPK